MKHGITLIFLILLAVTTAFAQPKGEIFYTNDFGIRSDTIDFGIVLFKNSTPVKRAVTLKNTGNVPLQIAENLYPHFAVQKINPATTEFTEFDYLRPFQFPFRIENASTDSMYIAYTPTIDTVQTIHPLGERSAKLTMQLTRFGDTSQIATLKDFFTLTVLKTKDYIASRTQALNFDSVYIGAIAPVQREWLLQNVSDSVVTISTQNMISLTTRFKQEFFPPINSQPPYNFIPNDKFPISLRFSPQDPGLSIARYSLNYSPNIDNQSDSTSVLLRGIGVEQRIDIDNKTTAIPGSAVISSQNAITISSTRIGDSILLTFVIRNNGNIPFGMLGQYLEGDTNQFYILKKFRDNKHLHPKVFPNDEGEIDTALVVFKPSLPGNFSVQYIMESDIRSRIASAPDSVKRRIVSIIAKAAKPSLALLNVTNFTINFGEVLLPFDKSCNAPRLPFTLRMQNIGSSSLRLRTAILRPTKGFEVDTPDAEIGANQESSLIITFVPDSVGDFTSELLIPTNSTDSSNEQSDTIRVSLVAKAISPPQIVLSVPKNISARAGRTVCLPIICSDSIFLATSLQATVIIEDTLGLLFVDDSILGTASEGAQVSAQQAGNIISITINTPVGRQFYPKDTLICLMFRTFLSPLSVSAVTFGSVKIGRNLCANAFPTQPQNGTFSLDSVCGQAYREIVGAGNGFNLERIAPNPSNELVILEYSIPFAAQASISLYTSFGKEVTKIEDGILSPGIYQSAISTADLAPGMYFCVLQSGLFRQMQPIVVQR
ncbi:MAG: T9SS type A sorting domain-containing protein [Ignavibacteria bacterium]|nr:T9SS type A sorting domain-containing protein [Ignavibacteria bacterium]